MNQLLITGRVLFIAAVGHLWRRRSSSELHRKSRGQKEKKVRVTKADAGKETSATTYGVPT